MSQRRRRNYISKLKNQDGQFTDNQVEMGVMATDFYRTLYKSEGTVNMNLVLDTVPVKVTAAMIESLVALFYKGEIKRALFSDVSH